MKVTKLDNCRIVEGANPLAALLYADATIETGMLFWKRTEMKTIFGRIGSPYWKFADTGTTLPYFPILDLVDAYIARENDPLKKVYQDDNIGREG